MKISIAIMLLAMCTACSTVSGLGKDLTTASEWTKEKISGTSVDLNR